MELTFVARQLLLASWYVAPTAASRDLPGGVEPALTQDGRAVVSAVAFRAGEVRADGRRVPSYSQLNIRTYVRRGDESGIFLLALRVTPPGLGGIFLGAPVRPARLTVREGQVRAPGLGVSLRYRRVLDLPEMPEVDGEPLGAQSSAFLVSAGLRRLSGTHGKFDWEQVEPAEAPRFDPVLALGFDVGEPDSLVYADRTPFSAQFPLEKLA